MSLTNEDLKNIQHLIDTSVDRSIKANNDLLMSRFIDAIKHFPTRAEADARYASKQEVLEMKQDINQLKNDVGEIRTELHTLRTFCEYNFQLIKVKLNLA